MAGTITANQLIDEFANAAGLNWNSTAGTVSLNDITSYKAVNYLNRALRWIWKTDDPYFAWPASITSSASVTITSGVITWAAVSSSDWVSFWNSDPSVYPGTATPPFTEVQPVPVSWDGTQFRVHSSSVTSPCFAYWRSACPVITWAAASTVPSYATPLIQAEFVDPVVNFALAEHFRALSSMDRANDARAQAIQWKEGRVIAIQNSDQMILPWKGNVNIIL